MVNQAKVEVKVPEIPRTPEQRMEALEGVVFELIDRVESLTKEYQGFKKQAVTKPKGLFGGKRTPSPMKDLKTGVVYPSKAAVGKNLATEAGADPVDTMAYYTVIKVLKMADGSDRFVEASPEESTKAREAYKAQVEKEVAEMNAKLQAEQEAEAKAKGATPAAPATSGAQQTKPKQQPAKK